MPLPRAPKAVVFDMDGLLIDSEQIYRGAIFAACADFGYEMTDERHRMMVGAPWDTNRAQLAGWFGADFPADDYLAGCHVHFRTLSQDGVPLRPGAADLIAHLAAEGIPAAVATSARRVSAVENLSRVGLLYGFRAVVTRDDVSRGKPDPEVFLLAAQRLDVAPADCLALEDSHNGVRAASAAGMMTVMVPDLLEATPDIAARCVHVAHDLHEVRGMLQTVSSPPVG